MKNFQNYAEEIFKQSIDLKQTLLNSEHLKILPLMALNIHKAFKNGNKLLLCGNGGSAADAQHLAAELLIRLRSHIDRPSLPAMTLAMDSSTLTACGNDFSFSDIFSRPLEGIGIPGDILLAITTSGNSENIIKALKVAQKKNIICYGFLGCNGGKALQFCEEAFIAPSNNTARIQEVHITAGHALMDMVENLFLEATF